MQISRGFSAVFAFDAKDLSRASAVLAASCTMYTGQTWAIMHQFVDFRKVCEHVGAAVTPTDSGSVSTMCSLFCDLRSSPLWHQTWLPGLLKALLWFISDGSQTSLYLSWSCSPWDVQRGVDPFISVFVIWELCWACNSLPLACKFVFMGVLTQFIACMSINGVWKAKFWI